MRYQGKAHNPGRSRLFSYGRILTRCFPGCKNRSNALSLLHMHLHIDRKECGEDLWQAFITNKCTQNSSLQDNQPGSIDKQRYKHEKHEKVNKTDMLQPDTYIWFTSLWVVVWCDAMLDFDRTDSDDPICRKIIVSIDECERLLHIILQAIM